MFKQPICYAGILLYTSGSCFAQNAETLPTIEVKAVSLAKAKNEMVNPSATLLAKDNMDASLQIGELLKDTPSIRADNFGGGASRPIMRGHNAPRVQVTKNTVGIMDASQLSPDHAVVVEPILAERIEVINGPETLLFGGGNSIGGVVNIEDKLITDKIPKKDLSGEIGVRFADNDNEKTTWGAVTTKVTPRTILRLEGFYKDSDDYKAQSLVTHTDMGQEAQSTQKIENTFSKQANVGAGISWVGNNVKMGLSHQYRADKYGIAGHNHVYESCEVNALALDCGHAEEHDAHSESESEAHGAAPFILLDSNRSHLKIEWLPEHAQLINKVTTQVAYTDYQHQELDEGEVKTTFKHQGYDLRTDLAHHSVLGYKGIVGLSYQHANFSAIGSESYIPAYQVQKMGVFMLEKKALHPLLQLNLGLRWDYQQINAEAFKENLAHQIDAQGVSSAASLVWQFKPQYTLDIGVSSTVRLPQAQELLSEGVHLATNTYELGNPTLAKERANNLSVSLKKQTDIVHAEIKAYINDMAHYIYAQTLDNEEDFKLIQYQAADARFKGWEGKISVVLPKDVTLTVLADSVRATLKQTHEYLPRIPSDRFGIKVAHQMGAFNSDIFWQYMTRQHRTAPLEAPTEGYHKVDVATQYQGSFNNNAYNAFLRIDNLFNARYYNHASFLASLPQQGRKILAGIRLKF